MIKRENRLRKNRHFQYIYRKGEVKQTRYITVVYVRTHIKPFKVGFSVSKKVGNSVVRSKVKRQMTETFNLITNLINPNYNYVFIAKIGLNTLSFLEIKKEMEKCLKKASLING